MSNAVRIGRLGMLAVGLGIGTALAATPGTASADSFPAPFDPNAFANSIDALGIGAAAAMPAPASATDIDISIDGFDVFNGGGTATATSGLGDMAIAIGPNSIADAEGGFGDLATAYSTGNLGAAAIAGTALSTDTGNNFDIASAYGESSIANAGGGEGSTGNSFDIASAFGDNGPDTNTVAQAGFHGSGDYASAVGLNVNALAGNSDNPADPANFDSASAWGNLLTPTTNITHAFAGAGLEASGGSNDLAFVIDPFGTIGSGAEAGLGNNFDLAGALGDNLTVLSSMAAFVSHIAPFF